jgi:hypothetical protein
MTTSVDPRTKLENLVAALDHERPTDEEAREVVAALGVDVPALAARIRARAATATGPAGSRRIDRAGARLSPCGRAMSRSVVYRC